MAFLRVPTIDSGPVVEGGLLTLRMPQAADYQAWAELRAQSREFLTPWEPTWARDELSRGAYRRRLRHYAQELRDETGYAFLIFRNEDGALLGGLSLSNIRRGVTQSAALGYWMGMPHAGQGFMTEAVRTVLPFVFNSLWLHRLEAACLPRNVASTRVLERNGFVKEGIARRYLKIDGRWQDHVLYATLADDSRG
ncbi:MAG: GNAT family protein [Hyphomicrobiaceae bacterium]